MTLAKGATAVALAVSPILVSWTSGRAQSAQNTNVVQSEVSAAEIDRTLRAIDVDRTSGSNGERASAELTLAKTRPR